MHLKAKTGILAIIALGFVGLYVFYDLVGEIGGYIFERRIEKVIAMVVVGGAIAFSTILFQTVTNNRILTPSIIGLDSLYMLIQTIIIFLFGSSTLTMMNSYYHFLMTVGLMILFAGILYKVMFRREEHNIYFLLLMGIILGTLFQSMSSFMQVMIDPNEFQIAQDRMFASFNRINTDLLWISLVLILLASLYYLRFHKYLDALALGREHAINLGVEYDKIVKQLLIIIAVLISVSTALVGPITFLGLIVVNIIYEYFKTYRHLYLIWGSILISIITVVGGQFLVERIFNFSTPLSVIINFFGGLYFIYLLLKEHKV
jgi:iron complex transport system permease protein